MDYRRPIPDDELPVGASPWSTSPPPSPRRNESTDSAIGSEATSQPTSQEYGAQSLPGGLQEALDDDAFRRPDTAGSDVSNATYQPSSWPSDAKPTDQPGFGPPLDPNSKPHDSDAPSAPQGPTQLPTQAGGRATPSGQGNQGSPQRRQTYPQYKLQGKITGLERTGRKDPILRFDVHTNIPKFRTTQFRDVRRLHSEFVKLAEHLISANPEAIVPAVPPPLTSAGAGTDEDEARVKALMQRWLNYVCNNEVLMRDEEMVLFVESDFGYSPMVRKKQPATGVRRKLLKQFAPPPDDTPELSAARPTVKLFYLGSMDASHKVDKLVKARRGLGLAESDFGVKLSAMNVQEPHQGLANAYRKLGKAVQTVGDCHAAQATAEATTIGDPFQYHSQDAFIVKETLTNRQLLTREFLQAQDVTRSKLNAADRLKASSNVRREKVDEAITALEDAKSHEFELMTKTQRVTQNLMHEHRKWFVRTAADLRMSIREYVLREIEAERRTLALLETVRPDIRAIDASGGLSRLGREATPSSIRRASMAASQGPKGDAWSGVPRRTDLASRSFSGGLMSGHPGEDDDVEEGQGVGSSLLGAAGGRGLPGLAEEEDDEDRVDARNAASRLATSTF